MTFQPVNEVADAKAARKARQAFYTPLEVGAIMVREADLWPSARVLEPSAGDGRLVHLIRQAGVDRIDACETDASARERLIAAGEAHLVGEDFLAYRPAEPYDRILMNPPFKGRTHRKHIEHAWSMLRKGGRIVTLGPNGLGPELARCELALPGCVSATWEIVERNAFREYGTGIEVTFAVLDRELDGPEPECLGFSNHSTAGKVLTIEHRRELFEAAPMITTPAAIRDLVLPALLETGDSAYGVNWLEVLEHFQARRREHEDSPLVEPTPAPAVQPTGQLRLFREVA